MSLEPYRRKRDFSSTPEPAGGEGGAGRAWNRLPAGRRFCVQMHDASRLHFDFRLEHAGVLLSWAVPKGPPFDPAARRLAMRTEDHPLEYGDFEGVIPAGYGAGTVMLWDAGVVRWERETAEIGVAAGLEKGDLKFSLWGSKLRGEFALVHTGSRGTGDGAQWLWIKKADPYCRLGLEAARLDYSARTGRSLREIAAAGQTPVESLWDRWDRAPAWRAGEQVRPMLATAVAEPFRRPGWLFETKYDGVRSITTVSAGQVRLQGRSGRDQSARYPELGSLAGQVTVAQAVIDGEIVALDPEGRPSFELLQRRINLDGTRQLEQAARETPVAIAVFDLLVVDGRDIRNWPLLERKRFLRTILLEGGQAIYADHVETEGVAFFAAARAYGLEGVVAKLATSRYESGRRSPAWLKIRAWLTQDCVICGYTRGRASRERLGALVLGVFDGGRLTYCGKVGSGFDEATVTSLLRAFEPLRSDTSPFAADPGLSEPVTWLRPELVCSVRHLGWTSGGGLRQPTYRGLRPGVTPADCVRERERPAAEAIAAAEPAPPRTGAGQPGGGRRRRPAAQPASDPTPTSVPPVASEQIPDHADALAELAAMPADGPWAIGGRRLRLTNLDRVLWPDRGLTKRDLVAYYVRIARHLLPYLRDRPIGMQVFPSGIAGRSFWRKRIPEPAPEWIQTWTHRGETEVTYVLAHEVATLAWLGNSAVIDLHPWHSRIDAPDLPDWAVFDLDPFPPAGFDDVRVVARLVRAALDHFGLRGYPKLSGQTGLQIYVPIDRGPSYAEVRRWVEEVGQAIGRVARDRVTWEWEVAKRAGRIRIDYTQNGIGKTLAAPYSPRPAPGAPVSTPVTWEELEDPGLGPDGWNLTTIEARIEKAGDLFRPVLAGGQRLPA